MLLFQSLIGILMNCNSEDIITLKEILDVSIPNRDFDELQLYIQNSTVLKLAFQSLIGILMNCNRCLS